MRKTRLLAVPLALTAFVGTSPAYAQGVRICEIEAANSTMTFTPTSSTSGNWTWDFNGRVCLGADGAPSIGHHSGGYLGSPCVAMVLTGGSNGVIALGALGLGVGVLHSGPGTGYIAVESVVTLSFNDTCTEASVQAVQVHVV